MNDCSNEISKNTIINECPKIKTVYFMNVSDCNFKNGKFSVKRKYGKFERPIFYHNYKKK